MSTINTQNTFDLIQKFVTSWLQIYLGVLTKPNITFSELLKASSLTDNEKDESETDVGIENQIDTIRLRQNISTYFSKDEIEDLCFELNVDFDELVGERKSDKSRELVTYIERRGRTLELVELCEKLRPNFKWRYTIEDRLSDRQETFRKTLLDAKPVFFAVASLAIGSLMASTLSVKNAPEANIGSLISLVVTQVILWILYAVVIHFTAKGLGGQGKIGQTISGVLYVLGTLHLVMILVVYFLSTLFPNVLTYDLTLRRISDYDGVHEYYQGQINLFGFGLIGLYWSISFLLTMIYLSFPLKVAHKLSYYRILSAYFLGILAIGLFAIALAIIAGGILVLLNN